MKNYYLIFIGLCISASSMAQKQTKTYRIKTPVKAKQRYYDINQNRLRNKKVTVEIKGEETSKFGKVYFGDGENANKLFVELFKPITYSNETDSTSKSYYELQPGQKIKLGFRQWSLTPMVSIIKVKFRQYEEDNSKKYEPLFSSARDVGLFFGHSWGQTTFTHGQGGNNTQVDTKHTIGVYFGVGRVEFDRTEVTNNNIEVVNTKSDVASLGLGYIYNYQKLSFGATTGFDWLLRSDRYKYFFHGIPWVSASIGYTLFTI